MSFQIQDGTGSSKKVKVDSLNRMSTSAVNRRESKNANSIGESFLLTSGYVTYTVATSQALLFLKNNEERDLVVDRFNFNLQASTGGSVDFGRFIFFKNPESISNGTVRAVTNLNFGSSIIYDVDAEAGDGSTSAFIGGTPFGSPIISEGLVTFIEGNVILPKGTSLGIGYLPPSGNTSQQVAVGINIFKAEEI